MHTHTERKVMLIANIVVAATWLYHGIIPKLMHMETGELPMVEAFGLFKGFERGVVYAVGVSEVLFGLAFLLLGKLRLLHYLNIICLALLAMGAFTVNPGIYLAPFNPATTSFGVIGLSLIVLIISKKNVGYKSS